MAENKIIIKYKIDKFDVIKLFGIKFIEKNKYLCKMEIDGKELFINEIILLKINQVMN